MNNGKEASTESKVNSILDGNHTDAFQKAIDAGFASYKKSQKRDLSKDTDMEIFTKAVKHNMTALLRLNGEEK